MLDDVKTGNTDKVEVREPEGSQDEQTNHRTNEYLLPVSYGLEEHLPKLGCNPCSVYLKAHFSKTVKGKDSGIVTFSISEWAKFFGVGKSMIHNQIKILEEINFIEWVYKSKSRHKPSKIRILKDKKMSDFNILYKEKKSSNDTVEKCFPQTVENKEENQFYCSPYRTVEGFTVHNSERYLNGKPCNSPKNNGLQSPKNVKECNKNIYIVVFDFWNSKKITNHREPKKFFPTIKAKIDAGYSVDEIKEAISNYAAILNSDQHFLDYRWTLKQFLTQDNAFEKFLTINKPFENYRKKEVSPAKKPTYKSQADINSAAKRRPVL